MAKWRQAVELALNDAEIEALTALCGMDGTSKRGVRAAMLLAYREQACSLRWDKDLACTIRRYSVAWSGRWPMARWRLSTTDATGQGAVITRRLRLVGVLACDKAKEHGYARAVDDAAFGSYAREHGSAAGHECLAYLVQGTVCKILGNEDIKPHKVRYYLENRDAEFEQKMAEVLCVYGEVQV